MGRVTVLSDRVQKPFLILEIVIPLGGCAVRIQALIPVSDDQRRFYVSQNVDLFHFIGNLALVIQFLAIINPLRAVPVVDRFDYIGIVRDNHRNILYLAEIGIHQTDVGLDDLLAVSIALAAKGIDAVIQNNASENSDDNGKCKGEKKNHPVPER